LKEVIFLSAKRSPKRNKDGEELPGEFTGNFRRRVSQNTPGAFHYSGVIEATKKAYDYYATEADILRGYVRWVDVITDKFGTSICLYIESERFLFRVALDYNVQNLQQIGNYLVGMKAELNDHFFNVTYDAWVGKDKDGKQKMMDNGNPRWNTMLKFGDAKPFIDPKGMREYLEQKGLAWEKKYDAAKNKEVYDSTAETVFWLKAILSVQKHLLTTDHVLPFTYNSIFACEAPHASGCGNLSEGERASCKAIYEAVRSEYRMPFGREMSDADDVFGGTPQQAQSSQSTNNRPETAYSPANDYFAAGSFTPSPTAPPANGFENLVEPLGAITDLGVGEDGLDLPF